MRDYLSVIPATVAVVSALLFAVTSNLFRDKPAIQMRLLIVVGILAVVAVAATIYGQYLVVWDRKTEQARKVEIREKLGEFIARGNEMLGTMRYRKLAEVTEDANVWIGEAEAYLLDKLGQSYVTRFRDSSDPLLWSFSVAGLNDGQQILWSDIRGRLTKLETFSQELPQ